VANYTQHAESSQAPETITVAELARQFISSRTPGPRLVGIGAAARPLARRQAEWSLLSKVLDRIGETSLSKVTRQQVAEILQDIARRGAPVTANRAYYLLRQCFRFAVAQGLMPCSPIEYLPLPGGQEKRRTRALSDSEIAVFWQRIESANMDVRTKLGLKLVLVLAPRPGDIMRARWLDFDLEKRIWLRPVTLSNSGRTFTVPLSKLALDLLAALRRITGNSNYLLTSPRTVIRPGLPYSVGVLSHAVRRNEAHWGIARFTPYDLRRTAALGMWNLRVPPRHIAKALNLSVRTDWAFEKFGRDYFQEKQAALNLWAGHLERLVGIVRADTASTAVEAASSRPKSHRRSRSLPVALKGRRERRRPPK